MKRLFSFIVFVFISFNSVLASFEFAGDVRSFQKSEGRIEFTLSNCLLNVYVIDENLIRFRYTNQKQFSQAASYAVIYENKSLPEFKFAENSGGFEISTKDLVVKISKSPCRVSIFDAKGNLVNEDEKSFGVSFDSDEVRCFKRLFSDEDFFGLGEKPGQLSRKGNQYTMWNSDKPGYSSTTDPLYQSIPFFIGMRNNNAYGIFFDNTYKSQFNFGASNNRFYWFGAEKGEMDYYFIYGPSAKRVISSYAMLTGKMEMPPLWALGYQQSKWSYYPESTVRTIAKNFRDRNIPCDVLYLDIHYMNGYRVFTWDKSRFPDPEKMLKDLSDEGFKIVPIIDPGVKADTNYFAAREGLKLGLFAKYPDGEVYQGEVWPSWAFFPDFTKPETRQWWGEKLSALVKQGVQGFWNDMNEPAVWGQSFPDIVQFDDNGSKADHKKIHNVFALNMARATFEGLKKSDPDRRHFILTRAGYSGVQRYSAVWTGDNVASEEHLRIACLMPLSMGISGIPFVGSDAGGFIGVPTPSLYARWMELASLTPFFRGHSAINLQDKEPWAFGEETEGIVRNVISLRYRMLPLLYNEFYNSSQTGLPVMAPLFLNYQSDSDCLSGDAQSEFMIGENLLVAPVLSETDQFKKLYLPEGKWLDYWSGRVYDGKQWIIVDAPIWKLPLFLKEGAIIPLQEVEQYVGQKKITERELRIFPSVQSNFTLYEDDGISYKFHDGQYCLTNYKVENTKSLKITSEKLHDGFKSAIKTNLLNVYYEQKPTSVTAGGRSLNLAADEASLKDMSEGYLYESEAKKLYIKVASVNNIEVIR